MKNRLKAEHSALLKDISSFLGNEISAADLKHSTAPFGIYQQRDGLFMTRIRITGGHLRVQELRTIANIMDRQNIGYAHLTTRQDIQLQEVPPENIYSTIRECTENGLPFKGGGGNTFRNIAVSPDSGIGVESIFDVIPYSKNLTEAIFQWDKAFSLPRKLKIGFAASERDELMASTQDLGFLAQVKDGIKGFMVYGGGGMGRESSLGVTLFDFIPAGDYVKCARAMTDLFYDHGDRENRNKARIRFIVKRLGKERFIDLFREYYAKVESEDHDSSPWDIDLENELSKLNLFSEEDMQSASYRRWLKYAVSPTRFADIFSVKIFVPEGNLNSEHIRKIAELSEFYGASFVRLTAGQDILLPLVHNSALPRIFKFLGSELSDIDLTVNSFKGHITSCVGATVCKIGILDSPAMAKKIAAKLDEYFKDKEQLKAKVAAKILEIIKISGCPNSCGAHPLACIGLQGQKKKINEELEDVYKIFIKPDNARLSLAEGKDFIRHDDVPEKVLKNLKGIIK